MIEKLGIKCDRLHRLDVDSLKCICQVILLVASAHSGAATTSALLQDVVNQTVILNTSRLEIRKLELPWCLRLADTPFFLDSTSVCKPTN